MGAISFSLDVRLVERIKKALPLSVFFETGTFKGDTTSAMLPYFDRLITAELSEPLWKEVTRRFSGEEKVEPYLGNSPDLIARFRPELNDSSVLYWLDAHWCVADDTSGEHSQCPLLEEICAIGQLNDRSIVLIDDARLFLAAPPEPHEISQWPSVDSIVSALHQISSQHELSVVNDVIIFYPAFIRNAIIGYARKHGVDWLRASQSYSENSDLRCALDAKQAELNNIYPITGQLQTQLEEKEAALLRLTQNLEEKEAVLVQLTQSLDEKEVVIKELSEAVDAYRSSSSNPGKVHDQ